MGSKKRRGKNIQCGSLLGVKMKREDGKPNFSEQRLKAGGETKGTRPPLDEDPLFHLWLLQVSITCFLTFNLIDSVTRGLPGFWAIIWFGGFVLLGIYTHMRKRPPNHIREGRSELRIS